MVGAEGFEPPALCSQSRCATRLRYAPTLSYDCNPKCWKLCANAPTWLQSKSLLQLEQIDGGSSSVAERLTVAQDVEGSIPSRRPNFLTVNRLLYSL